MSEPPAPPSPPPGDPKIRPTVRMLTKLRKRMASGWKRTKSVVFRRKVTARIRPTGELRDDEEEKRTRTTLVVVAVLIILIGVGIYAVVRMRAETLDTDTLF